MQRSVRALVLAGAASGIGLAFVPSDSPALVTVARLPAAARPAPATLVRLPVTQSLAPSASAAATPPPPPPCPPEMAHVDRFCIDRWEAHLVVGDKDGPLKLWPHTQPAPTNRRYEARSAEGQFPQGYINQLEAARACDNAGKRLCRFDEWRKACVGHGNTYGYGKDEVPGRCNNRKTNLLDQLWGHDARGWSYETHMNNPLLDAIEGYLARSGEYEGCASEAGVHDQVGNLHEWLAERVTIPLARRIEGEPVRRQPQPYRLGNGMLAGGFFSTGHQHGPGCYYLTLAHVPTYHDYSTGFRCCSEAR